MELYEELKKKKISINIIRKKIIEYFMKAKDNSKLFQFS